VTNIDQRRFVNQRPAYLSGREAAALLGIKRETLYAYASRGLVRSEPGEHGRERRYFRDDLDRLKVRHDARAGHGPVAAGALRWGEPVLSSALTAIDQVGPLYRGRPALLLAEKASFEAVAELLWATDLPAPGDLVPTVSAWEASGIEARGLRAARLAALLPKGSHPLSALLVGVPALAAADPERFDATAVAELQRARALILRMTALLAITFDPRRAAAALREESVARAFLLSVGARGSERAARAVDRALILSADHELNPSTFTVRIAASARADLYACVSAGLATLSGPRHGGTCDRVEALVAEAGRPEAARAVIHERARRGENIPGFGHPLYPHGDPRAAALLDSVSDLDKKSLALRTLLALVEAMRAAGREAPAFDTGLVALAFSLGLPPGSATSLFAIGRTAGWIAHTFEQRAQGFLLRPRAHYTGPTRIEATESTRGVTPGERPPPGRDRR
jgi:citrate synthase